MVVGSSAVPGAASVLDSCTRQWRASLVEVERGESVMMIGIVGIVAIMSCDDVRSPRNYDNHHVLATVSGSDVESQSSDRIIISKIIQLMLLYNGI